MCVPACQGQYPAILTYIAFGEIFSCVSKIERSILPTQVANSQNLIHLAHS